VRALGATILRRPEPNNALKPLQAIGFILANKKSTVKSTVFKKCVSPWRVFDTDSLDLTVAFRSTPSRPVDQPCPCPPCVQNGVHPRAFQRQRGVLKNQPEQAPRVAKVWLSMAKVRLKNGVFALKTSHLAILASNTIFNPLFHCFWR
jgi:hypothetical protein